MGLDIIMLKKITLIFLIISASLFSTSFAGRAFFHTTAKEAHATHHELSYEESSDVIHERLLKMNTKDYGRYDPTPTFVKPPFKLIPN